ncbi:single-stranded DNA-binding protein [Bacteroides heparinolyticus]|uniref:single-stranded DNA-binding protein n=1 Tax=Prevotella heparinolytica TaxID=28113 RepID=UPI00359FAEE5|nr:single-stranded DNA-binding protein [Bacteroides heparinolyticus]
MLQFQIIGNLGSDAELKEGENKKSYISFSVAHTEHSGLNNAEKTIWVSVWWYGGTEKMLEYLKKGTKVFVSGRAKVTAYLDKDKAAQPGITVFAFVVELCGKKVGISDPEK